MWELDIRTGKAKFGPEFAAMLGYNPEEYQLPVIEWTSPLHPEDRDRAKASLDSCIHGDYPSYRIDLRMKAKSGDWKWCRLQGQIVERDREGKPVRMVGMHADLNREKMQDEVLSYWSTVLEQCPDGVVLTGLDGMIKKNNTQWNVLHGYEAGELHGKHLSICHTSEQMVLEVNPMLARVFEKSSVAGIQVGHKRKNGTIFFTKMSAFILKGQENHPVGLIVFAHDITEERKRETLLRQAQKMETIGQLSGGIAHDLNNILSPILGFADMIIHDMSPEDRHYNDLCLIKKSAERAKDLTWQLLAFSRKQVLEMKKVDLIDVTADFQKILRRTLHEDIAIKVIHSTSQLYIHADPEKIRQILINLAINAQNAMPEGGTITIETTDAVLDEHYADIYPDTRPGRYVLLSFSDTGCGMDQQTMEHIFEPFFTTKEPGKGTGLGLAMVYGIVKQHRGHVMVYSELGMGTTFKIYLPCDQNPAKANEDSSVKEARLTGTETVLVVEDEDSVRELICRILKSQGYTVISANGGKECLDCLEHHNGPIHLLLTDVVMPDMNGRQVYEHASRIMSGLKVIFISGYTREVIAEHGILMQGVNFLPKPFTVKDLSKKVRAVLDKTV
jgi:PAS domain S-box-containing protein